MLRGTTVKGFIAVTLMTLAAFAILGGLAVALLGIIEGNLGQAIGGIFAFIGGAIGGRLGSWLYDEENMNEEI